MKKKEKLKIVSRHTILHSNTSSEPPATNSGRMIVIELPFGCSFPIIPNDDPVFVKTGGTQQTNVPTKDPSTGKSSTDPQLDPTKMGSAVTTYHA